MAKVSREALINMSVRVNRDIRIERQWVYIDGREKAYTWYKAYMYLHGVAKRKKKSEILI